MVVARRSSKVVKCHFLYFCRADDYAPGPKEVHHQAEEELLKKNHAWMDLTHNHRRVRC